MLLVVALNHGGVVGIGRKEGLLILGFGTKDILVIDYYPILPGRC